jgi:hypothetical protein
MPKADELSAFRLRPHKQAPESSARYAAGNAAFLKVSGDTAGFAAYATDV